MDWGMWYDEENPDAVQMNNCLLKTTQNIFNVTT